MIQISFLERNVLVSSYCIFILSPKILVNSFQEHFSIEKELRVKYKRPLGPLLVFVREKGPPFDYFIALMDPILFGRRHINEFTLLYISRTHSSLHTAHYVQEIFEI